MTTRSCHRWLPRSFGMRALLMLVVVLAIPLSWIAYERQQSRRELLIAAQLQESKLCHIKFKRSREQSDFTVCWSNLAQAVLGERPFFAVSRQADANVLRALSRLQMLQELHLSQLQTGNVQPIGDLKNLRHLVIDEAPIIDLRPVSQLMHLQSLVVNSAKVSDIRPLARLTQLEHLSLSFTRVNDLTPLARLTNLKSLSLYRTPVRDVGPLAGLSKLTQLDLRQTHFGDLKPLFGLVKLEFVYLDDVPVSDEQVAELQKALPNCKIER